MIRQANLNDLKLILIIEEENFENPWSKEMFDMEIQGDYSKVFLLDDKGFIVIHYSYDFLELADIAVKKEYQGQGIGKELMDFLDEEARRLNIKKIFLEVNVNNIVAYNLYKKCGYKDNRLRKNYYPDGDAMEMKKENVIILAIESSCDETACAIVDSNLNILSSVVTSQIDVHARFGGVIPEVASRMHVEQISVIVEEAIKQANISMDDVDAIAYTIGPGLIGSLHIGGIAAKTLAFFYNKPLIGVHHLRGHIFINELVEKFEYPMLSLVVSGGHSELVLMKNDESFEIIGTTMDDAVGESYDKIARVIGLEYPGGPKIDKLSKEGEAIYKLPVPKVDGYNFSFSGLKNATITLVNKMKANNEEINTANLSASFQEAALKELLTKTKKAINEYDVKMLVPAGGVACNSRLRELLSQIEGVKVVLPPLKYCTDNAVMIACAALHYYKHDKFVSLDASSEPSMSIED